MAEKRMFTKKITESDAFLDMPSSSQMLYFHLNMEADDEGFVNNPKKIQRMCGASDDDMRLLIAKSFIIIFESGIIVIKHWKMHNYIQADRFHETVYQEEKAMLETKENKAYTLGVSNMYTECIQDVSTDKIRLDKNRLDKVSIDKNRTVYYPNDEILDSAFRDYVAMRKKLKAPMTDRAIKLAMNKLEELSGGDNDTALKIVEQSIMHSWKGLFELSDTSKGGKTNQKYDWDNL